nr:reverse transcriptase domain-containing protein [Tanacetum cinerariifolium]
MLAVVYAFEKFRPYLVLSKSIVYTDHSALKYLLNKQNAKPRLLRWVLLLQEFHITILDKKGSENLAAEHLSRLENPHQDVLGNKDINENFPLETLGSLTSNNTPWFADIANFHLAMRDFPEAIMVPISQRRRVVVKFLKSLFSRFGTPWAIISDRGIHFCNDQFTRVMIKYGVTHRLATAYHSQTSGQVEVSNRGLKRILERTTLIGCTPYKLVYGKSCHLPTELEHRAYWALKHVNFDLKTPGDHRKLQLNELSLALQFSSQDFLWKLKTRWSGPFTITRVFPYGTIELSQPNGPNFKVNGHRVKHYFGGDVPSNVAPDLHTFSMDN